MLTHFFQNCRDLEKNAKIFNPTIPFFRHNPLSFNSRQPRLHDVQPGKSLWLVSRDPADQQYYFVGRLTVAERRRNPAGSPEAERFGEYAVVADPDRSTEFARTFPAEGLLRALGEDPHPLQLPLGQGESPADPSALPRRKGKKRQGPLIKYGASIGQSLQTIRFLAPLDERVLNAAGRRLQAGEPFLDAPFGLWTKCNREFAEYFLNNWTARRQPLAFLLYDSPPALLDGSPVFIHSDAHLRLVARFRESQYVASQKFTVEPAERLAERDRIWTTWRADTLDPPTRPDFDAFWNKQHGIRALFVMDEIQPVTFPCQFKDYGKALEWGYPTGVGYRYLTLSQSLLLLRQTRLPEPIAADRLSPLLQDCQQFELTR